MQSTGSAQKRERCWSSPRAGRCSADCARGAMEPGPSLGPARPVRAARGAPACPRQMSYQPSAALAAPMAPPSPAPPSRALGVAGVRELAPVVVRPGGEGGAEEGEVGRGLSTAGRGEVNDEECGEGEGGEESCRELVLISGRRWPWPPGASSPRTEPGPPRPPCDMPRPRRRGAEAPGSNFDRCRTRNDEVPSVRVQGWSALECHRVDPTPPFQRSPAKFHARCTRKTLLSLSPLGVQRKAVYVGTPAV